MRNLGTPMTLRRPADFLERSIHRAAPQPDQYTLRAVQQSGVSPRGICYRCPEVHDGLPFPASTKSNLRFSSVITFAKTSACGA